MRRIPRSQQSIDCLVTPSRHLRSSSPCLACRSILAHPHLRSTSASFTTSSRLAIIAGSNPEKEVAFAQKWQKKLFGKNFGRVNPYDPNSPMRPEEESEEGEKGKEQEEKDYGDELYDDDVEPFKEATSWEGLERVGGEKWLREYKEEGRKVFKRGYLSQFKLTNPREIELALHRAVVEVFTLRQKRMDLNLASRSELPILQQRWVDGVKVGPAKSELGAAMTWTNSQQLEKLLDELTPVREVTIASNATPITEEDIDDAEELDFEQEQVKEARPEKDDQVVDEWYEEELDEEDEEAISTPAPTAAVQEYQPIPPPPMTAESKREDEATRWDSGWRTISLAEPAVKFAIVKRMMQLTGNPIPDPIINESKNVGQLLERIAAPPKAKTLLESIKRGQKLEKMPNVKVHERRSGSIDRDRAVGRWKVIEYALQERGLPVRNKE